MSSVERLRPSGSDSSRRGGRASVSPSRGSGPGGSVAGRRRGSNASRGSRRGSNASMISSTSSMRSSVEGFVTHMASGLIRELKNYPTAAGLKVPLHTPICSSHLLQTLLYYNVYFSIVWFCMYVPLWAWKAEHIGFGIAFKIISPIILALWAVSEPVRLIFGYTGNLKEKVPQLAAFFLLTAFPQIPALVYFLFVETNQLTINVIFNVMQLSFLVAEFVVGWIAIQNVVKEHNARFCLLKEQGKMFVSPLTKPEQRKQP